MGDNDDCFALDRTNRDPPFFEITEFLIKQREMQRIVKYIACYLESNAVFLASSDTPRTINIAPSWMGAVEDGLSMQIQSVSGYAMGVAEVPRRFVGNVPWPEYEEITEGW
jgi:hypothetical protein